MKYMDHTAYPESLTEKSAESLRHIIADAKEAHDAMPYGVNSGYYLDEISYAAMELKRRQRAFDTF